MRNSPMTPARWRAVVGLGTVCVALLAQRAESQVNIEALRATATDTGFSGVVGLNLVLRTGNIELLQLGECGDISILNDLELAVTLSRRLSLLVRFDLRYDSRPPDEIARLETSLKNGLSLTF